MSLGRIAVRSTGLLACLLAGCQADPHGLEWGFELAPPALRARTTVIEARILRGGCAGGGVFTTEIPVTAATSMAMDRPGELGAGRYGLSGSARDVACTIVAEGCVEVDLPADADARHVVALTGGTERPACDAATCANGSCRGADAGPPDAGSPIDAGPRDAGPPFDSGGVDAGARDAGPPPPDAGPALADAGRDAGPPRPDGGSTTCAPGTADCDTNGSCETSTTTDDRNCGMCGRDCGEASCTASTCTCAAPLAFDGGSRCRDLTSDPSACSAIGTNCRPDQYCHTSMCRCRPGLETIAAGACTDLQTDPGNCGMAGRDCSYTATMVTCRAGTCEDACTTGQTNCSNACVQLDRDPRNCGSCGRACPRDQVCVSSACRPYRPAIGCTACPCASTCRGDFDTCCADYGGNTICVNDPGSMCPQSFP